MATASGKTIEPEIVQDARLADFGYQQELKRSFNQLGSLGFAFSIVTSWTALAGVLIVGIEAGGPPVIVWGWVATSLLTLFVAYSFAEMCSAFPVAGGQYSWVAILAPPKHAKPLAWVTGWFMNTGIVAMGATNNFVGANFILGMANLNNPDYVIERWHTVLVAYLMAIAAAIFNIFGVKWLNSVSSGILYWNVLSFLVVVITILATNDHKQSARFVFVEFQDATGFSSPGMAVMICLLQAFFGMCCYDAPSKMVEEMKKPSVEAPKAIIHSVYLGAVTGLVFLVSALFCISDIDSVAGTSTGVPIIQIFYDSTQNVSAATTLSAMITIIVLVCANALMAEGSRGLWAFSRDRGLPFSDIFSRVNKRLSVPVNGIILCMVLQMALNSIYFASYEGFSTVIALATFGFYLSYAMTLFVRLLGYYTGHVREIPGPYSLGRWSPVVNMTGLIFLTFAGVIMNFPQVAPVTADNMNYCSAAFGVIATISIATWVIDGRKNFTGPETKIISAVIRDESDLADAQSGGTDHDASSNSSGVRIDQKA